ncbi:hypothetical protein HU200_049849 [Digitaria exilis]|uniref:F-box domain-containing protein n=1 Tax=Digitaria exilis TaxID=1010633 RepID=A0A835ASJ4_9POAL|nr:hypothetical protein HU200_049849 [Digitaria exilis]
MWGATRATTARRRCACVPVLPDELLLAKALLRCRAVCRSWRRLTSAADFVLAHHQIQPSLPLVFLHGTIRGASVTGATLDAFDLWATPADERRRPTLRFKHSKHYREFKVYASCDGLLLFSLSSRSRFYICNPATRQWMLPLPMMLIGSHVAGLYRHSSSGESRQMQIGVWMWMLLHSSSSPCVGQPATSASIRQYMTAGPGMPSSLGARLSCSMNPWWCSWRHLIEMDDGTLGISYIDEWKMSVKLWVLEDYAAENLTVRPSALLGRTGWPERPPFTANFTQSQIWLCAIFEPEADGRNNDPKTLGYPPASERPATTDPGGSREPLRAAAMTGATRARSSRRRRACGPVLPDELVLWEILVHLPAKALLRCRAVCRSWRRLTSAPDFLLAHHRLQPSLSLPLVFLQDKICDSRGRTRVAATLEALDLWPTPATATDDRRRLPTLRFRDYKHDRALKVYASCDGLLLFSLCGSRLPMCLDGHYVAGLYRHSPSGEYRVLYRMGASYPAVDAPYYVLTVGSDAKPRCVGLLSASASIKQDVAVWLWHVNQCPPVMLHGCLHWLFYSSSSHENVLLVFDTVAESFRTMCPPTNENSSRGSRRHLLEMDDGTLGVSYIDERKMTVKLWVLKDYEAEVWSLKYEIELRTVEMRKVIKLIEVGMTFSFV